MGAFTEAAPVLAGLGVPTIPTRAEAPHVPRVKHPESLRVGTMQKLLNRPGLASANAAILCGPISGISVVDVDSPYPIHHEAALEAFGDTPLKISTPSLSSFLMVSPLNELGPNVANIFIDLFSDIITPN